ncbi:TetR/AcrR family transcriptional regulator [Streptomyces sp. UNOB3_S3]|uniref:TetR/AcrR family transcriptional regulator n=1 Tax=Streptomyces sp. UNOB3_S3 TaxID=2871682 RepID=UPI001E63C9C6|nr:TetR/AcrR family transcriptional regulator [Streptomyces sp. UNOB3_S3]MCC3776672.1 TetR/AcrR family transcriptional regulator [Streptomyces sp. UNOB3_S3]
MTKAKTSADSTSPGASPTTGMRGRKRERTRRAISDAAFRLFAEQGFEAVTLTRIAAEADVAPATVFTHFASKEDIFFSRREEFRAGLPDAVTPARTGAELIAGLREFYGHGIELVLAPDRLENGRVFARVLRGSPALTSGYLPMARERQRLLTELLVARAPHATRAELELFAALTVAAGERGYEALHIALEADEPVERVRAAANDTLDLGFSRLARAYEGSHVLDAEPS